MADETRVGSVGLMVAYIPERGIKVGAVGVMVVYRTGLRRKFPIPDERVTWQTQADKREFPVVT